MAVKISELPSGDIPLTGTEQIPVVQGGTTKAITTQDIVELTGVDNKQAADEDLTALSLLTGTGYVKKTGAGAYAVENLVFLTSETDPVFAASAASGITGTNITNWDSAFSWGNHSLAGYQSALVSGTNIKTLNGSSLLGSGDITVSGGASTAAELSYDNTTSGLAATDVQGAIDELTMPADPLSIFNKTFLYKKGYGAYLPESAGFMKIDCTGVAGWLSTETGAQTGQFKTSGKWYFEVEINSVNAPTLSPQIGVSGPAFDLGYPGAHIGAGGVGWTIVQDGRKRSNNSLAAYGSTFTAGNVVGVAVDLTGGAGAGKIWFAINNVWQASGDPAAGTNAAYTNLYAMVSPSMAAPNSAATLRISSSSFTYSPPTGFSAWDS